MGSGRGFDRLEVGLMFAGAIGGAMFVGLWGLVGGFVLGYVLARPIESLLDRLELPSDETERLALAVSPMLDGGRASGAQAAGRRADQAVRFWTEGVAGGTRLNCSVRAPRGATYLEAVAVEDLDIEPFAGPGELVIRRGGLRAVWTPEREPLDGAVQAWVSSILAEADGRLVAEAERIPRLVELAEAGKPSAFEALVAEAPEQPRLGELADLLQRRPEPESRLAGARWQGAGALEALIDDLAYEPVWQARALRARADVAELPTDAVRRWAGVPGLRLELLIDQMRHGPVGCLDGLVDSAPTWVRDDAERLSALADVIVERGVEVESVVRRLFETQPAGRVHLARALGEIGGMPALATLRATWDGVDWPQFDADEAAVEQATARIIHRLGGTATGLLALDEEPVSAGGLAVADQVEPPASS